MEPTKNAEPQDMGTPRLAWLLVLGSGALVECLTVLVLPALGVSWFRDNYRVGGFFPLPLTLGLSAWWADRRWP
jgi:hypothetical protein